jgi:mannose/fructose-specific phosphotransferase system component IIA
VTTREIRGIVVAHGSMAAGLVEAASRISGVEDGVLVPVSNEGLGPEDLRDAILSDAAGGPAIVFTDLAAGSCTLAARVCCSENSPLAVVTGVNLAMLLDFLFHRELPLSELVDHVVSRGRDGVRALIPPGKAGGGVESTDVDPTVPR